MFAYSGRGLPGLHIEYVVSPLLVQVIEKSKPLSDVLINLCAIVGGVFTIVGLLDRAVFWALQSGVAFLRGRGGGGGGGGGVLKS